jgi:hypothetical protein
MVEEERFWQSVSFWSIVVVVVVGLLAFWLAIEVKAQEGWKSIGKWEITSYNCVVGQCDSEPDIGAFGKVAEKGNPTGFWFAGNKFKKGDQIVIPSLTGEIIWTCKDRTAKKVNHRIDLLFPLGRTIGGVRHAEVFSVK